MSENKEGFVARIFTNEGTNARGAWYAKSFKIADANGNEDPFFFLLSASWQIVRPSCGFAAV